MSDETPQATSRDDGTCPAGWQATPLASIADIRFSGVNKVAEPNQEPVRLCNYTDVYANDYILSEMEFMHATATRAEIERFGLQIGDVIITKDSETPDDIGVPAVVDSTAPDLVCGYHLAIIRPKDGKADPAFLAKQLEHHRLARYFGRQANGSTRYGLSMAAISNAVLHLPSPAAQRSAGALFRLIDATTASTEAVIAKLKQMRTGLLRDLLTRGLDEHGQLRDPVAHPDQFKGSPLGRIPRDWRPGSLNDLVHPDRPIVYGILMPGRGFPGGVPVIKVKDIRNGTIDTSDLLLTDPRTDEAYARSRVMANDLLFTIRGTVGRMALVPSGLERANITQDTARISLSSSNPLFVARWLEMEYPTRFVNVHTLGVAVQGINLRDVRKVPAVVVPRAEQDAIVKRLEMCEELINREKVLHGKLTLLKSGLISDLLAGRARVPGTIGGATP